MRTVCFACVSREGGPALGGESRREDVLFVRTGRVFVWSGGAVAIGMLRRQVLGVTGHPLPCCAAVVI